MRNHDLFWVALALVLVFVGAGACEPLPHAERSAPRGGERPPADVVLAEARR